MRCPRAVLAALIAPLLAGCGARETLPEPPAATRAELILDGWTRLGPADDAPAGARVERRTFTLDEARLAPGAVLVLERMWWSAQVTVNGVSLPSVQGGPAPVSVPVGEHLHAGQNTIVIQVTPPTGEPPLITNGDERHVTVGQPPRLVLRPVQHLGDAALAADDDGVRARFTVGGSPAGARIRAHARLDGELLQVLGEGEVVDGAATVGPVRWRGPRWDPTVADDRQLVQLVAELIGADGATLDVASWRTGVRTWATDARGFRLNGEPFPLIAQRLSPDRAPSGQLSNVRAAALDGVEIHGEPPTRAWLAEADELGVPVVAVPRCDGRLWGADRFAARDELPRWQDRIDAQDRALVWWLAAHPSLVLWACDGDLHGTRAMCQGLSRFDPRGVPAAGADLESYPLPGQGLTGDPATGAIPPVDPDKPVWINEVTTGREGLDDAVMAAGFEQMMDGRGHGGVIPSPRPNDDALQTWSREWSAMARRAGAPALALADRRASSRVRVSGLAPGEAAWLEIPWLTPVGAIGSHDGTVDLRRWHRGGAEVVVGGARTPVSLEPDRWVELQRVSQRTTVTAPR